MQNCVTIGVRYSSPTLGSALANLIPAFTFLLAIIFSKNHWSGNLIRYFIIYDAWLLQIDTFPTKIEGCSSERVSIRDNVGFLLLPLWVHSICIGYFDFERDPNAWMLSLDIELISVVYSALFGNVVTFSVQAWCIWHKGSVFVATLLLPSWGSFSLGIMVKKE
ncbi:hypothetical protein CXB51_023249 [Gossypium anomalum]|uniref:Uncharacterized protein n=1 Tax=Gossypium anomalum TaxID=47600 RepID=A0A8J5YI15_9ROSI|nr:hypothetical protein CXB51_023249 [Gossypium anomalum]